jgi:hypothetical protein
VAAKTKRARVKLLKGVRIAGKHVDAGKTIEVDRALANDLTAANQAELVEEDEESRDGRELAPEQMGVHVETPTHGDPGHVEIPPKAARVIDKRPGTAAERKQA